MGGEDGDKEANEEELSFMILTDRLEGYSAHEALEVDRFLEHAAEFVLEGDIERLFDHLDGCLTSFSDSASLAAFEEKRADSSCGLEVRDGPNCQVQRC